MGKLDETDQIKKLSDELSTLRDTYAGELRQRAWLVSERDRAQAQQAAAQRQLDTHMAQVEAAVLESERDARPTCAGDADCPACPAALVEYLRARTRERDEQRTRAEKAEAEQDAAENRARLATQLIIEHIGADGPQSLEEALARLLARVKACAAPEADAQAARITAATAALTAMVRRTT